MCGWMLNFSLSVFVFCVSLRIGISKVFPGVLLFSEAVRHVGKLGAAAAGAGSQDCKRWVSPRKETMTRSRRCGSDPTFVVLVGQEGDHTPEIRNSPKAHVARQEVNHWAICISSSVIVQS